MPRKSGLKRKRIEAYRSAASASPAQVSMSALPPKADIGLAIDRCFVVRDALA